MGDIAVLIGLMRTGADVIGTLQSFEGLIFERTAVLETAKSKSLAFSIKSIGTSEESTRSKGPAVLIISTLKESLLG